ncbi:hypothetical protein E2C01_026264 [Portunus trituberculatus]|uniref:Uncharacterized protein n=1 Tax=Portunus trituberculatus TaxID=210409 RepID=A0A5B7EEZ7_PORTR|nr:hypothetical protein [Portunus trituberculatus]
MCFSRLRRDKRCAPVALVVCGIDSLAWEAALHQAYCQLHQEWAPSVLQAISQQSLLKLLLQQTQSVRYK